MTPTLTGATTQHDATATTKAFIPDDSTLSSATTQCELQLHFHLLHHHSNNLYYADESSYHPEDSNKIAIPISVIACIGIILLCLIVVGIIVWIYFCSKKCGKFSCKTGKQAPQASHHCSDVVASQEENRGELLYNQREKVTEHPVLSFSNPIDDHSDVESQEENKSNNGVKFFDLGENVAQPPINSVTVCIPKNDLGPQCDHSDMKSQEENLTNNGVKFHNHAVDNISYDTITHNSHGSLKDMRYNIMSTQVSHPELDSNLYT